MAEYQSEVDAAAALEAITPLINRRLVSFGFTGFLSLPITGGIKGNALLRGSRVIHKSGIIKLLTYSGAVIQSGFTARSAWARFDRMIAPKRIRAGACGQLDLFWFSGIVTGPRGITAPVFVRPAFLKPS